MKGNRRAQAAALLLTSKPCLPSTVLLCSEGLGSLLSSGTATLATGAALEAGLLAGSGALQAAGAALDAASAALAAELGAPAGTRGRRLAGAQGWLLCMRQASRCLD